MQFDFLEAANGTPLTKTFRRVDGRIDVDPYPLVYEVNSHRTEAHSIEQLYEQLHYHASLGRCLLKGLLREQLHCQSRAGMTEPMAPTRWVLLDLDFAEGWDSIDAFIAELNPNWIDVSYIFQHSSSAGIHAPPGLRGHIWILLDEPASPAQLKLWLRERNLKMPALRERMTLAANGLTAKWPLDVTTCQNDKLIYIAPPTLGEGIEDPLEGKRFELITKARDAGSVPRPSVVPALLEEDTQQAINELRKAQGLKPRKITTRSRGAYEVLVRPDRATVTGVKTARGFTYINLNGGDSWGYYFPEDTPELVFNFKDEPIVRLRDVDPDFYAQYVSQLKQQQSKKSEGSEAEESEPIDDDEDLGAPIRPYVFRERTRDVYYNILHYRSEQRVEAATASSMEKLDHFMRQYGRTMPDPIEDWTVTFDPTSTDVIRPQDKWLNLFTPTDYLRYADQLTPVDTLPPITEMILRSICGDEETLAHFLNWLAFIFQTRQRANTAWVFHGTHGTGKGLLLSKILRPLFGPQHVLEWMVQNLEDQFNAPLEHSLITWLDEFQVNTQSQATLVMNKLKGYITEDQIAIRGMRRNTIQARNWQNVIIATNHPDPIELPPNDRRFNVAPAQETPLRMTQAQVDAIEAELPVLASFLHNYKVDTQRVRAVLLNDARTQMIQAAQPSHDRLFAAVREGDLNWFLDYVRADLPMDQVQLYQRFESAVANWCRYAVNGETARVSRDELQDVYSYLVGHGMTPTKFTRMCNIQRVKIGHVWINGRSVRGRKIEFTGDKERMNALLSQAVKKPRLTIVKE